MKTAFKIISNLFLILNIIFAVFVIFEMITSHRNSGGREKSPLILNVAIAEIISVSPPSATNTATLNPISNHPQVGIELKKDIGFWFFAIPCWLVSLTLFVFGTIAYFKK